MLAPMSEIAAAPLADTPPPPTLWLLPGALFGAWLITGLDALPSAIAEAIAVPLLTLVAYWLFVHFGERRLVFELSGGLTAARELALGGLLALVQPFTLVAVWYVLGVARFDGVADWHGFSLTLGEVALGATWAVLEEVAFRGLILRYTELKLGSWPAIVLSAVLFGLWHLQNPDMTALSIVELSVIGLALGAAYVLTRRLWMPIGLHATYNIAISLLFPSWSTIPLLHFAANGSPYFVTQTGQMIVWLAGSCVVAGLLVGLVFVRRAAVGPRSAWARQMGAAADEQLSASIPAMPSARADAPPPSPIPVASSSEKAPEGRRDFARETTT